MRVSSMLALFFALAIAPHQFGVLGRSVPTGASSGLSLLTMSDLTWNGEYKVTTVGSAATSAGSTVTDAAVLAVRYVVPVDARCSDQRRFITFNFSNAPGDGTGRKFGDPVEYCTPAGSSYYTGTNPTLSTAMVETRRWDATQCFAAAWGTRGDLGNGNFIGGIRWDDTYGGLWVNTYGYYYGSNMPARMFMTLLDTANVSKGGDYMNCGSIYGPWFYMTNTAGANIVNWKLTQHGELQIPATDRSFFGGRDTVLLGAVGAVATAGHLGVGGRAVSSFDPSTLPAGSVFDATDHSGAGLPLFDYSLTGGSAPYSHRPTDYTRKPYTDHMDPDTGLYTVGTCGSFVPTGCWQMSMDQSSGVAWVKTAHVQGIVMFGRQAQGGTAYGYNPLSTTLRTVPTLTASGTTATVTLANHKFTNGAGSTSNAPLHVACVIQDGYNGTQTVHVVDANTLTYTVASGLASPASGKKFMTGMSQSGTTVTITVTTTAGMTAGDAIAFVSDSQLINGISTCAPSHTDPNTGAAICDFDTNNHTGSRTTYTISNVTATTFDVTTAVTVTNFGNLSGSGGAAGYFTGGGNDPNGNLCWKASTMVATGWDTDVQADQTDLGRANPEYTNGYSAETYTGAIRLLDPTLVETIGSADNPAVQSPYNDHINWAVIGNWYTQTGWNIPPFSNLQTGATSTRIDLFSVNANGLVFDPVANQLIWIHAMSAAASMTTSQSSPTFQFFTVR